MITTYIQIPDPALRQFPGHGPNFIAMMPPDIAGLEVRVDWEIITYLDDSLHKGVLDFLEMIEAAGLADGYKIVRHEDFDKRQYVYTFE